MERLCDGYKKGKYVDEAMFYRVQEDFKEYTDEDLVLIRRSSIHRLRDVIRSCSVYIPKSRDLRRDLIHLVRSDESQE